MMLGKRAVEQTPDRDGIVLGGHGLFTWGKTQKECYENTLAIIDQLGQFVLERIERNGSAIFGGPLHETLPGHRDLAIKIFPFLRGAVSGARRLIGNYNDLPEVKRFGNSSDGQRLAHLGTSCPDHFIRTKVRPLFVPWEPGGDLNSLPAKIAAALEKYRGEYADYYRAHARPDSPAIRDANPTVVLIPGIGMFSFGKSKTEARLTGEFYVNAIHVMEGATSLASDTDSQDLKTLPQAGAAASASAFEVHSNYVALPLSEAFRIEYWQLEEAKLLRQPPEKELSRQIVLVVGGGSGIGRKPRSWPRTGERM